MCKGSILSHKVFLYAAGEMPTLTKSESGHSSLCHADTAISNAEFGKYHISLNVYNVQHWFIFCVVVSSELSLANLSFDKKVITQRKLHICEIHTDSWISSEKQHGDKVTSACPVSTPNAHFYSNWDVLVAV